MAVFISAVLGGAVASVVESGHNRDYMSATNQEMNRIIDVPALFTKRILPLSLTPRFSEVGDRAVLSPTVLTVSQTKGRIRERRSVGPLSRIL
jgi:hypothetical protein